ncbi:heterokaryon incompatibility protein-domain-containing protein [Apiospora kogelbergensis]|uniref:heterokaryon incompatibility protein-domain-containing protein n=1 Tax=Apiospora kogelbergensis TaxID=1337665 RepID=UPI003131EFFC
MSDTAIILRDGREPRLLTGLCQYCTYTFTFKSTTWLSYDVPWNRLVRYPELAELLDSGCSACEMLSQGIRWHLSPNRDRLDDIPDIGSCGGKILLASVLVHTDSRLGSQLPVDEDGPYQCDLLIKYGDYKKDGYRIPFRIYGNPRVRLVATDDFPPGTAYATLSHVWGSPQTTAPFLTTTNRTVSLNKGLIQFEALPRTFRDAVEVTRALGLRYVWIDSLCIIQDSPDDWHQEAPRMAKIYSNAYVTIVATSAKSANDGFLERKVPEVPPAKIPYSIPNGDLFEAGHCYLQVKCTPSLYHEPSMDLEAALWNSRGWTFQERILSRRLIHFTKDLIFIECWSSDWSEDNRVPGNFYNRMPWLGGGLGAQKIPKLCWVHDKLPALAGVIERLSEITGFHNVAGLWKEDFANGLTWTAQSYGLRGRRLTSSQEPSWSWASWEGPICFTSRPDNPFAETATVCFEILHIEPVQYPFTQNSGHLRVKGLLLPISKTALITGTGLTVYLDIENDGSGCLDKKTTHDALEEDLMAFPPCTPYD